MSTNEAMTILRIRQWSWDRAKLRAGETQQLQRSGWRERRQADARLVRVLDFERVLAMLPDEARDILLCTYRDRYTQAETSAITGISTRALVYKIPAALNSLANTLDRLNLLWSPKGQQPGPYYLPALALLAFHCVAIS